MREFNRKYRHTIESWVINIFGAMVLIEAIINAVTDDPKWLILIFWTMSAVVTLIGINIVLKKLVKR